MSAQAPRQTLRFKDGIAAVGMDREMVLAGFCVNIRHEWLRQSYGQSGGERLATLPRVGWPRKV
jgi:hypothetical protein